jgi:histidinol dehydrogenase
MIRKYSPSEAQNSILVRQPMDAITVPKSILDSLERLFGDPLTPDQAVTRILDDVRKRGDAALSDWSERLDGNRPERYAISEDEIQSAWNHLPEDQQNAIELAAKRIRQFHAAQPLTSWITQASGGMLGQLVRPIRRVGLYIPGGSAPLPSTILMSAIPAQVAGVKEIVLVTPPQRKSSLPASSLRVAPILLAVAAYLGINEVYTLGGAQAIAALAYGTLSIPRVDKIFGPGNLFVTLAKRQVYGVVGIDGLAGPTETMVIADDTARADWVAADLLAQAEHDGLAAAILLTPSSELIAKVQNEMESQIKLLDRNQIIESSLGNRSGAILTRDIEEAIQLANQFAPEHLCLSVKDPWQWIDQIHSAGGIFIGEYSFEVLGDYIAGPSHVMPTGGSARFASPLNVLDFVHFISLVGLDPATTAQISPSAAILASAEGLSAHASAARFRMN